MPNKTVPTYAILVPVSRRRLETIITRARRELDVPEDTWQVVGGTGKHAAVWDFDPAGDWAYQLAPFISRLVAGTVYIAQLHEHMYGTYAYEGGAGTTEAPKAPEQLAQRLGVPFPEPRPLAPASDRVWSVCVIEGVGPETVQSGLELTPEDREVVRIEPNPLGTIVFATDDSGVSGVPSMLTGAAAEATSYVVERCHGEVLKVWIQRGSKICLFFTTDDSFGRGPDSADHTWDIKGAKDAAGIVAALHIPPALLGW